MSGWAAMPHAVRWTIVAIFVLLGVASAVVEVLRRIRPGRDHTELRLRVRTWWVMIVLFVVSIVLSRGTSIAFFAFVSFLALKEYLSLIPTRRADRRVLFWAYLAIPLQYWWVWREWYGMFIIFIPVYMFLFLPVRMVLVGETKGFLRAVGTIQWGLMTTVFCLSHLAFLLVLRTRETPAFAAGPGLVLFLAAVTQANDVSQYIWGKSFGRTHIAPTVSPNKTWAGFLGGVATTVLLAGAIGPALTPMGGGLSLFAGLLIAVFGFCGDLVMAAVKRDMGVKDYGTTLPGHGGVMDRVNSLIFTAPLFFHLMRYMFWWKA